VLGEFLCKNANKACDFLNDLIDRAYEWKTIMKAPTIACNVDIDKAMLPNDIIALQDTMLHCEHQLEVPPFQPPQPHDYILPSCSCIFRLLCWKLSPF